MKLEPVVALAYGVRPIFASRIVEMARQAGVRLFVSSGALPLAQQVERIRPQLVVVDLEHVQVREIALLRSRKDLPGVHVVGLGSNLRDDLAREAREAGCDRVLTDGGLARGLQQLFEGD